jgi:hypothetical protein
MAFVCCSTDLPLEVLLSSEWFAAHDIHLHKVSNELNFHEIPMKLSSMTFSLATSGASENISILTGVVA